MKNDVNDESLRGRRLVLPFSGSLVLVVVSEHCAVRFRDPVRHTLPCSA